MTGVMRSRLNKDKSSIRTRIDVNSIEREQTQRYDTYASSMTLSILTQMQQNMGEIEHCVRLLPTSGRICC